MSVTSLDTALARDANSYAVHHDGIEDAMGAYAAASEALFLALTLGLVAYGLVRRRHRATAVTGVLALAASGAALLVAHLISTLVDRPRPFVAHPDIHAFLVHAADASFPSDHVTAAAAIAAVLLLRGGARWAPLAGAVLVLALARVMLGLHYPGDVLAGALIGTTVAAGLMAATRRGLLPRIGRPLLH